MRVFLVVIDETNEARSALTFAAQRAASTNGALHILSVVPQQNISAFGGVQDTIEQESRDRAELLAHGAAGNLWDEIKVKPIISVVKGIPKEVVSDFIAEHEEVAALVLGAAEGNSPGPLVSYFSANAGSLPAQFILFLKVMTKEKLSKQINSAAVFGDEYCGA